MREVEMKKGGANLPLIPTLIHTLPHYPTTYHACFTRQATSITNISITATTYNIVDIEKQ